MERFVSGGFDAVAMNVMWAGVKVVSGLTALVTTPEDPGDLSVDVAFERRGSVFALVEVGHAPLFSPSRALARVYTGSVFSEDGVVQVVDGLGVVACAVRTEPGHVAYEIWIDSDDSAYLRIAVVITSDGAHTVTDPDGLSDEVIDAGDRDTFGVLTTMSRWPIELIAQTALTRPYGTQQSRLLGTVMIEPDPTSMLTLHFLESRRRKFPENMTEIGRVELGGEMHLLGLRGNFGEIVLQVPKGPRAEAVVVLGDSADLPTDVIVWVIPSA